jgi:Arc/MetJ-type ribon-helix-helix transcriptional regulator
MDIKGKDLGRISISITLPEECVEWLDKQVQSRVYHNRSHAVELAILKQMKEEGKKNEGK